jgi:type I restriction enzyme, S subunit
MKSDWELRHLGDIAEIVMGQSPPGDSYNTDGIGLPLLNGPTEFGSRYPVPTQFTTAPTKVSRPGDVIFCVRGSTTGRMNTADQQYCLGRGVAAIRGATNEDTRLIHALLQSELPRLLAVVSGSTFPNLSRADLHGFEVLWPDLDHRRRIARVLGALDDKIEHSLLLNRRLVSWCSALFRQEIGEEADDWLCLGDVLETLETGSRPRGGVSAYTEGVPSIGAESIVGIGVFDFAKVKYVPEDYFLSMKRGVVQSGDVLLYKDGGRPGMFEPHVTLVGSGFPFDVMSINEHVYRLRTKPPYSQEFLYFWLRSKTATEEMRARGTGVAIPGLNSAAVKALAVPVVEENRLHELTGKLSPAISANLRNARTAHGLQTIRNLLLPKLVSGQIRVPESYDPDYVLGTVAEEAGAAF